VKHSKAINDDPTEINALCSHVCVGNLVVRHLKFVNGPILVMSVDLAG
jgi:hypothetical protein